MSDFTRTRSFRNAFDKKAVLGRDLLAPLWLSAVCLRLKNVRGGGEAMTCLNEGKDASCRNGHGALRTRRASFLNAVKRLVLNEDMVTLGHGEERRRGMEAQSHVKALSSAQFEDFMAVSSLVCAGKLQQYSVAFGDVCPSVSEGCLRIILDKPFFAFP